MAEKKKSKINVLGETTSDRILMEASAGAEQDKPKPLETPKKEVEIAQPQIPKEYPKYHSDLTINPDGSVVYKSGNFSKTLTKEEYAVMGGASGAKTPNIQAIEDYEAVQKGMIEEEKKKLPEYITNQGQLDIYSGIISGKQKEKEARIREIAEREAAKPVERMTPAGSPEQAAGFVASGVAKTGAIGTLAAAGAAGGTIAALATVPVVGAAVALTAAYSLMANQGKNREIDIKNADVTAKSAIKYVNLYKTEALNPARNQEQLIEDYYAMKRAIYASEALIYERSLFDKTFRADEGKDELSKIRMWKADEDNMDARFFTNLANANIDLYNSQIGMAMQNFNAEGEPITA